MMFKPIIFGRVTNMLLTSCTDNVARLWTEGQLAHVTSFYICGTTSFL